MTKQEHIEYWKISANDDWQTVISLFDTKRTRDIFQVNPTITPSRKEAENIVTAFLKPL